MNGFPGTRLLLATALLAVLLPTPPAAAVIVAGANGGGNTTTNTDLASLNSWLASQGDPSFPFWDNVAIYGNGNATYLGTSYGWVLTANHVSNSTTVDFLGTTYDVVEPSRQQVGIADLELFRITHATLPLPSLPDIPLDAITPGIGSDAVLMGAGRDRQEDASTDPNVSDATMFTPTLDGYTFTGEPRIHRWGTNTTVDADPAPGPPTPTTTANNTVSLVVNFDEPAIGDWLVSNESQAADNDSGGPVWSLNISDEWELSGVTFALTRQHVAGTVSFDDKTLIANIPTYRDDILAIIAVPEPSGAALFSIALSLAAARRRRVIMSR